MNRESPSRATSTDALKELDLQATGVSAWWSLAWREHLRQAGQNPRILSSVIEYARFLRRVQLPSGEIPMCFDDALKPHVPLRKNATTALSGAVLAEAAALSGDEKLARSAIAAGQFVETEILPKLLSHDAEAFYSCPLNSLPLIDDPAGIPAVNTLAMQWVADQFLALHRLTGDEHWLRLGADVKTRTKQPSQPSRELHHPGGPPVKLKLITLVAFALFALSQGTAPGQSTALDHLPIVTPGTCAAACSGNVGQVATQPIQPAEYRRFALHEPGRASRGKTVFTDARFACALCHTVDGTGGAVGPDLLSIGDKYPRLGLIQSILEPSSSILPGYSTTLVRTKSGELYDGTLQEVSSSEIELRSTAGAVRIATRDIREQKTSAISTMPDGLHLGMTLGEFSDLIAYLETLKQPALEHRAGAGTPDVIQPLDKPIQLRPFHDAAMRFEHPVWFSPLPGFNNTFVILEHQRARIWLLEKHPAGDRKTLFADFDAEVSNGPFEGLVCIAFHPKFRENRKYYLKHEVIEDTQRSTVIVEKQASANFKSDSGEPSRRLLKIDQPAENHNGGTIAFGPDGYLYIGMGDGGPQEDPLGRSQSTSELLGKMLRIDVDRAESGKPYGIPPANPLRQNADREARPEIWALGLREPWRFSFDRETGDC